MIKVSVLIPVFNTAKTLGACLRSVLSQTRKDIEIVCVDDGSDRETKEELAKWLKRDGRIRAVTFEKNRGTLVARKRLIEEAQGQYLMFLDSDDTLEKNACEAAARAIEKTGADIVQFGTSFHYRGDVAEWRRRNVERIASEHRGYLTGKEVFCACFSPGEGRCGWNLWNKIFRAELLKRAAAHIPEVWCVMQEDFAIYFMAAYYARRYFGMSERLVHYHFGEGVSGVDKWESVENYRINLGYKTVTDMLCAFLDGERPKDGVYRKALRYWEGELFGSLLWKFVNECREEIGPAVFDLLSEAYTPRRVALGIAARFGSEKSYRVARLAQGAACLRAAARPVRTVGFFYHRLYNGGVERVLSALIPLFLAHGYKTVLLLEQATERDYPVPPECEKVVLPSSYFIQKEKYPVHGRALLSALKKHGVDALLYQSTCSPWFLYDMLIAKSAGVRVYASLHELLALPLLREEERRSFAEKPYILRLADGVQTIVKSDAAFLRPFGVNARYIPNPFTYPVSERKVGVSPHDVLWVGRLESRQKRPEHAILIMREVVRRVPDARLFLLGTAESKEENARIAAFAAESGLGDHIRLCGFVKDPRKYYEHGGVLLMTSLFEVWGMVLCEAMSFGMPAVAYEMPYLETMKGNEGCVAVGQEDVAAAAAAIVRLLTDPAAYARASRGATETAKKLASEDVCAAWTAFFSQTERAAAEEPPSGDLRACLENIFDFYERAYRFAPPPPPRAGLLRRAALFWGRNGTRATVKRSVRYLREKFGKKE